MVSQAHALGQDDAEAVEQRYLGSVGLGDAAKADSAKCRCRQDDIVRLNACELFQDGARRVSKPGTALPHLQALPQNKGEKANQDVSLNAVLALMPDRTDVQLVLLNSEGGFRLGELDIGFPELPIAPIADIRAQEISAFRESGPVVEGVVTARRKPAGQLSGCSTMAKRAAARSQA